MVSQIYRTGPNGPKALSLVRFRLCESINSTRVSTKSSRPPLEVLVNLTPHQMPKSGAVHLVFLILFSSSTIWFWYRLYLSMKFNLKNRRERICELNIIPYTHNINNKGMFEQTWQRSRNNRKIWSYLEVRLIGLTQQLMVTFDPGWTQINKKNNRK